MDDYYDIVLILKSNTRRDDLEGVSIQFLRTKSIQKEYVPGRSIEFTASSPSLVEKYVSYENKYKTS